jgi:hypothetical protein
VSRRIEGEAFWTCRRNCATSPVAGFVSSGLVIVCSPRAMSFSGEIYSILYIDV